MRVPDGPQVSCIKIPILVTAEELVPSSVRIKDIAIGNVVFRSLTNLLTKIN